MTPDKASAVPRGNAVLNGAVEASKPGCEIAVTLTKYCLPANNTPGGTVTVVVFVIKKPLHIDALGWDKKKQNSISYAVALPTIGGSHCSVGISPTAD
jgi:hypothetical protein